MNTLPVTHSNTNEREVEPPAPANKAHAEHVLRLARQLADGNRPGILATIDSSGSPQVRWMATLSLEQFPHLYALTSPLSRKVEHIRQNPRVTWMFSSDGGATVVHLTGRATIVTDTSVVNRVWRMIDNKSNAYFLALDPENEGVAVIDTIIDDIDCVIPRYDLHYPPRQAGATVVSPHELVSED